MTRPLLESDRQSAVSTPSAPSMHVTNALARVFAELAHSARLAAQIEGGVRRQALEQLAHRFVRGGEAMAKQTSAQRAGKADEGQGVVARAPSAPVTEAARKDEE